MNPHKIDSAFPFDSYREHQRDILHTAADALFDDGLETIVIDAPTGIGKSGINMALCALSGNAFYTTPQKELREQLNQDDAFVDMHQPLRGRADYECDKQKGYDCKKCPVNQSDDDSCRKKSCIYWRDKEAAMSHDTATLTFSFLIYDHFVPPFANTNSSGQSDLTEFTEPNRGAQISFRNRDLLVIDEAHSLEEQVASLHAGFTMNPQRLRTQPLAQYRGLSGDTALLPTEIPVTNPPLRPTVCDEPDGLADLYTVFTDGIDELLTQEYPDESVESVTVEMMQPVFDNLSKAIRVKKRWLQAAKPEDVDGSHPIIMTIKRINSVEQSLSVMSDDRAKDTPWVIDMTSYQGSDGIRYAAKLKPVHVDTYLQRFVWSRADKVVLSTATMPYRSDPDQWLDRLGLDPSSADVISRPMPFPPENRPIDTTTTVASFSGNGWKNNADRACARLEQLYQKHAPEKGLIHAVGYDRAEELHEAFPKCSLLDDSDRDMGDVIDEWQESDDLHMLLSPRMMEGVDLNGDMCRWQVLVKTPYMPAGDARVDYLLNEMNDWRWYKETAAQRTIQAAGRAVRSKDDYARYYVLDEAIENVLTPKIMPEWFAEAMV